MPFEQPPITKYGAEREKKIETGMERAKNFLKEISFQLKEEGFPVDEDCRINIEEFKKAGYAPEMVENDKKRIKERQEEWQGKLQRLPERERADREKQRVHGERLETLKTAIFHKFLGKDFFIVRSSVYDDIEHGVDNLIFDKETGNPVCAFDEATDIKGPRFEEKVEKISEKNLRGGGQLKYGLRIRKERDRTKVILSPEENIPIFYLAMKGDVVDDAVEIFNPSADKTEQEARIFNYFLDSIKVQISSLRLEQSKLKYGLRRNLDSFEQRLEELQK